MRTRNLLVESGALSPLEQPLLLVHVYYFLRLTEIISSDSSSATEKHLQTSSSMVLKRLTSERRKSFNEKELTHPPTSNHLKSFNDKEFANPLSVKRSSSVNLAYYPLADLQNATGNFASSRLLGEGSIGRVYRAKYPDGRVSLT